MGGSWNRYNSDEKLASRFKKVSFRAKNSQQGQSQLLVILNSNGLPEIDLCSVRERERQKENTYHVSLWGRCSLWCKKGSETLVRDNLLSLPPFAFCLSYLHSVLPFSLFELSVQTYLSLSLSPSSVPLPAKEPINRDCLLRSSFFRPNLSRNFPPSSDSKIN